MHFDEHLCDISHCFNCHDASRGPSAIAELLVCLVSSVVQILQPVVFFYFGE